jgi:methyl-accepting chemotaxis protein
VEECQIFESNGKQVAAFRKAAEARASGGNVSRVCAAAEQNGHVVGRVALVVSLVGVKEQERRIRTAYTAVQCTMRQAFGTLEGGVQEQSRSQAKRAAMLALKTSAGAVALGLMFALSTSSSVARPLRLVVSVLERAAERDSAQHLNVASRDEVGHMARALNKTLEKMSSTVEAIKSGAGRVALASGDLAANSDQMSSGARQASDKAHAVAAATEQLTAHAMSVAAAMEQATRDMNRVEAADEPKVAPGIAPAARQQEASIRARRAELARAVREIGKITATISAISLQTNRLALNAAIEAARAGAAGSGFAVVSDEIKKLADQTTSATEDIETRIEGMQSSTARSIVEIERVSQVIHRLSDSVTETSRDTRDIAKPTIDVDQAASQIVGGSGRVQSRAAELSRIAEQL